MSIVHFAPPPSFPPERSILPTLSLQDATTSALIEAIAATHVGVCLCDPDDRIQFANDTFREVFLPLHDGKQTDFAETVAASGSAGRGVRMTAETARSFVTRAQHNRRLLNPRADFMIDTHDGRWWWIADHKLPNGWLLATASDVSLVKAQQVALREAHAAAIQAANTDYLTGLPNRRCGFERMEQDVAAFHAGGRTLVLGLLDIDHFKKINDALGHEAGDRVLVHFARRLSERLGPCAHLSRVGGEEFMVVLPDFTIERARACLTAALEGLPPLGTYECEPIAIAASAGIAVARAGMSAHQLFAAADSALYRAKSKGRHRIEAAD